jgi:2'-5' RNA ligase
LRLFIAVNFNDETRTRLLSLRDELRTRSVRGNFSAQENLHLTLAFLGECNEKQAADIKAVMDTVRVKPFHAVIDKVGCFKRNGGDIWWAGVQASKPLLEMQRDLADKLTEAGFSLEQRSYNPHITLGREVITNTVAWRIEPFGEDISCIELMKSERINGKLTYTAIHERRV